MLKTVALPADLKILHVFDHSLPLHSGYAFRSLAVLREQRRRGWRTVHLTTPKHTLPGPQCEEIEGFAFHRTPAVTGLGKTVPGLAELRLVSSVARQIMRLAKVERPAVLHAHSPVLNALACLLAARSLRLPLVYEVRAFWEDAAAANGTTTEGSLRFRLTRRLETLALRHSAAVITICDGLRRDMVRRGIASEKIHLVPNGVDLASFPRLSRDRPSVGSIALRRSLGLDGKLVVGFLGSFYPYEGLDILLAALPAVRRVHPDICLLLAGGGQEEEALKAQASALQLADHVRFVGRVAHSDILCYYEVADVFLFPRRSLRLTDLVTPLKPLEAMAAGGIVLASDIGGHRELIRHGETGYLYPTGGADALAEGLLRALGAREEWPALRERARAFVERERSWQVCAAGYEDAYACALKRSAGQGPPMKAMSPYAGKAGDVH